MTKKLRVWIRREQRHPAVARRHVHRDTRHRRLGIERVEDRLLLSVVPGADAGLVLAPVTAVEGGFVELSAFYGDGRLVLATTDSTATYRTTGNLTLVSPAFPHNSLNGFTVRQVDGESAGLLLAGSLDEFHSSSKVELLPVVADELSPDAGEGGLIDLTRVINEPVHFVGQLPPYRREQPASIASRGDGTGSVTPLARRTEIDGSPSNSRAVESAVSAGQGTRTIERAHEAQRLSSTDLPVDQIDGSRGRCQAFELAMSVRSTDLVGTGQPHEQPGAAAPSPQTTQARSDTEAVSDGPQGSQSQRSEAIAAPVSGSDTAAVSEKPAATTSPAQDAVFAEMAEPLAEGSASAVYVDNNRQTDMIPLLAVAVAGRHLLMRPGHIRALRRWQKTLANWRDRPLRESAS